MDIGNTLREARQRHGLTLQEISRETKISVHVLDAIEHNDTRVLAGGLFTRGYLRAYANQVGLNPTHIVSEFRAEHEAPQDELRDLRLRLANRGSDRNRWKAAIIVLAGLALLVFTLYLSNPDRPEPAVDTVPVIETVPVIDHRVPSTVLPQAPA
jgi:cytoskeletal protein RodZ